MKHIIILIIAFLYSISPIFGQSCGVCCQQHDHTIEFTNEDFRQKVEDIQANSPLGAGEKVILSLSFSHTQALEDAQGKTALIEDYTAFVDSINTAFTNSSVDIQINLFEGDPLTVGTSTGNVNDVWANIVNNVAPYHVINEQKRCAEIPLHIHLVTDNYTGNDGLAGQAGQAGNMLDASNAVIKYKNVRQVLIWLIRHELGHFLGMGHEDGKGGRAFAYSSAKFNLDGSFGTIMYSEYLGPQFMVPAYSSQDATWNGYPTGDADHDNAKTAMIVGAAISTLFEYSYVVNASATTVCPNEVVMLDLATNKGDTYFWQGEHLSSDSDSSITFQTDIPGTYMVIGSTQNTSDGSCKWKADTVTIQVIDASITLTNNTLSTDQTADTYQWLLNGTPMSGATDDEYTATKSGVYSLRITINGVTCISNEVQVIISKTTDFEEAGLALFPNPNNGDFTISGEGIEQVHIFNPLGQQLAVERVGNVFRCTGTPGIYQVVTYLTNGDKAFSQMVMQ